MVTLADTTDKKSSYETMLLHRLYYLPLSLSRSHGIRGVIELRINHVAMLWGHVGLMKTDR